MRKIFFSSIIGMAALYSSCTVSPKMAISGSGWRDIAVVDKKTKQIEWKYTLNPGTECNSIIVASNGNLAFSYSKGACMINHKKQIVWDYKQQSPGEIHSIVQLENGGFLLGASGNPARLIELDKNGKEVRQIRFDGESKSLHGQIRQVRKSMNGNYLVPLLSGRKVVELDKYGNLVNAYPVPAAPYSVLELPNSNLIVSCGDGHFFVEIDRQTGKTIRKVDASNFSEPDIMHYVAEINRLDNGNLMLCNWNGHFRKGEEKQIPHLIEFDDNYNIVWRLDDFTNIPKISTCYYMKNGRGLKFRD